MKCYEPSSKLSRSNNGASDMEGDLGADLFLKEGSRPRYQSNMGWDVGMLARQYRKPAPVRDVLLYKRTWSALQTFNAPPLDTLAVTKVHPAPSGPVSSITI